MRQLGRSWVPLGLIGCALWPGCAEEGPPLGRFELSGVVVEDLESAALGGATVTFTSDTLYMAQTSTDGDGHYEMVVSSDVPFGQVKAQLAGFQPAEATVFFDSPERRIDLRLRRE